MRAYRLKSAEGPLHIIRGEFHRHSEISPDGGGDGTIRDQYRYMIDTAGMDWVGCCDHDNGNMMQGGGGRAMTPERLLSQPGNRLRHVPVIVIGPYHIPVARARSCLHLPPETGPCF